MTDERTETDATAGAVEESEEGTTVEGVATPTADEPTPGDDEDRGGSFARKTAEGIDPARGVAALRSDDGPSEDLPVRSLRLAISLTVVFGYVLAFGAAVGGAAHLLLMGVDAAGLTGDVRIRVLGGGALLLPAATFLYLALYDDADLTRPEWPDRHPPFADAWLLVLGVFGLVVSGLPSHPWLQGVRAAALVATVVAGAVGLPFWLARRCLRRPSWVLGGLTMLLTPLVAVGALLSAYVLPLEEPEVAAAVFVTGASVTYGFAAVSPGPDRLATRAATVLNRGVGSLRAAVGRE